ncbi:hypothetical protein [Syntrophomonas palmitatica]|uniref:hypothetical protein n=1 Tax=Syntrophomonas palmitatica TaxID=402877 RepID=UPI0006D1B927|nr:hypothetical protein [Syntrophomonas palmitatica]
MTNRGKIRYVFTSSNSVEGFYSYVPELVKNLKMTYILKGAAGSGKSTFIRLLGESVAQQGYEIEFWLSAADAVNPEGVYIPRLEMAVVCGNWEKHLDPLYPGATGEIINLDDFHDKEMLRQRAAEIIELVNKIHDEKQGVYHFLKISKTLKEEMKKPVTSRLNMKKLQDVIKDLKQQLFVPRSGEKHYFARAFTSEGLIDYIDEISKDCRKRYILRGPAGSGKSTVLEEIARSSREQGLALEYYHCGLEPDNLSMIIISSLETAVIDAGRMEISVKPWDTIIDMQTCLDLSPVSEPITESSETARAYEDLLQQARAQMEKVQETLKDLKKIYSASMDFARLDCLRKELAQQIINESSPL